ncbi:MAG: argininosuccinate lyase, partial [Candidatus Micrarchaeota archaeon]|nr:argininosuccinate lyase [Candidatus Micrarchaeota archaeon]
MPTNKLWDKGIPLDEEIEDFTVGEDYILDMKLVKYDCIASIAHAKMLGKMGILKEAEVNKLVNELNNIKELSEEGKFTISKKQEDVHTAIENMLTEALGELGG